MNDLIQNLIEATVEAIRPWAHTWSARRVAVLFSLIVMTSLIVLANTSGEARRGSLFIGGLSSAAIAIWWLGAYLRDR